jgi:fatty-acyl-CoA synthase
VAYGNEGSPQVVAAFAERFGVNVIDAFGATEGAVAVTRVDNAPAGALGLVGDNVKVVDEEGHERARARFDPHGQLLNADECVGEIVNIAGAGPFEGYYNNDKANAATMRNGWYWSGDLGYVDDAGFLYFAGRNADWIRVDGENFPAGPIETAISRHPDLLFTAVYGVPDVQAGDQVMAAVVLRSGAAFDPAAFAAWVDAQPDLGPKWRPRYVRVTPALPTSPSNKILKRTLVHEKVRPDRTGGDAIWVRERGDPAYRPFGEAQAKELHDGFVAAGRERFWDL